MAEITNQSGDIVFPRSYGRERITTQDGFAGTKLMVGFKLGRSPCKAACLFRHIPGPKGSYAKKRSRYMKRITILKLMLMTVIAASATMITNPTNASIDAILVSCETACIGSSGVTHNCVATLLGIPVNINLGINRPVQACGSVGSTVLDPVTQKLCALTPSAAFGIVIPVQDECGSYEVDVTDANVLGINLNVPVSLSLLLDYEE
jgi:hypothetical protein